MKKSLYYWLPPILWMAVIFYFSSRQRIEVSEEYIINFVLFKTLHAIEYAVLYFLFFRALLQNNHSLISQKNALWFALFLSVAYSIVDEVHQVFIPTRQGALRDVFIDAVGIGLMYAYIKNRFTVVKKLL